MKKPSEIIAIYDNSSTDNPTLDCMTFVLNYVEGPRGELGCLGTSYNGRAFSQFSYCNNGSHLGKRVKWNDLSLDLRKHVVNRLKVD